MLARYAFAASTAREDIWRWYKGVFRENGWGRICAGKRGSLKVERRNRMKEREGYWLYNERVLGVERDDDNKTVSLSDRICHLIGSTGPRRQFPISKTQVTLLNQRWTTAHNPNLTLVFAFPRALT